ncbi:unnamed protein product [Closterium sp. NIES-54]
MDPRDLTVVLLQKHLLAAEASMVAVGAARGTPRTPFFEGFSPSPLPPLSLLLLLLTSFVLRRSRLRVLLVGGAKAARAREAKVVGVAAVEAVVGAVEAVEVAVVVEGVVVGVEVLVAAVVAAVGVVAAAVVAAVGVHAGRLVTHSPAASPALMTPSAQFLDATELPRWLQLLRQGVYIFALDYDAILAAMYALTVSAAGDCYLCVPPNPYREAATLGASEYALPGTVPAQALHTFTLDSGASRCFFRDSTTLTPLLAPVPVRLADPSGGPDLARSTTILLCPAVPSGSLSGLHLRSFSTNLVSIAALQDAMVNTTTPGGQRVSICACTRTGHHLATFTRCPGSGSSPLLVLPPFAPESPLATPQWSPSLPRLGAMHSRLLVSGLPRSLPPLPPSPAPSCHPCVKGRQHATPHSSSFPPMTPPLLTLHMDVWGLARVRGQGRERYFLLVVDDYTRYTTVFPLRSKGKVPDVLIPSIRAVHLQLRERHGGRRTSMIHAAAPHFLWSFAVRYAAHQLKLWPHVSLLETLPTLRWTGEVGDASCSESEGAEPGGAEPEGAEPGGTESGGAEPGSPAYAEGPTGASSRREPLSPPQLREWFARCTRHRSGTAGAGGPTGGGTGAAGSVGTRTGGTGGTGAAGAGGAGAAGPGGACSGGTRAVGAGGDAGTRGAGGVGAAVPGGAAGAGARDLVARGTGAGGTGGGGAAGPGGARTGGTRAVGAGGAADAGAGDPRGGGARAGDPGAGDPGVGGTGPGGARPVGTGARGTVQPRPFFVPLLRQPDSPVPAPSPYTEQTDSFLEHPTRECHPALPVRTICTGRRVPCPRPPPIPGTHGIALRPLSVPLRVPLASPQASFLPNVPDPESDMVRAACPTVTRLLATVVTDPSFESTAVSALVTELVDFAAACRLDYAASLIAESEHHSPPSVGGECALGTDVLEDRQEDFECLAAAVPHLAAMLLAPEGDPDAPDIPIPRSYAKVITGPYSSQWHTAMDAEMASWKSTGTYVDAVPPPGANIVDGMWIFRVKRPPGSPPVFKARYVARGFSQ